jgi:hypothetical protein
MKGESIRSNWALHDYASLGLARSLTQLRARYLDQVGAPTVSIRTLEKWSKRYSWRERVAAWDAANLRRLDAQRDEARRRLVDASLNAADRLIKIVDSADERQARLASADVLDRTGFPKTGRQEVALTAPGEDDHAELARMLDRLTARLRETGLLEQIEAAWRAAGEARLALLGAPGATAAAGDVDGLAVAGRPWLWEDEDAQRVGD